MHLALDLDYFKIGLLNGLTYAVLASGLVLVYRATRVINFAHAQIGAFGAALLAKLVLDYHWNFWAAAALTLILGAAIGAVIELTVIRRLFTAPRVIVLVATIGVAQLLLLLQVVLTKTDNLGERFPTGIDTVTHAGGLVFRGEELMVLLIAPAMVVGLGLLLSHTRWGLDLRASAGNPDAARLAGIRVRRVSTMAWVVAAVVSTAIAILIGPSRPVNLPQQALDPTLLLKALSAAMVGRMVSLPLTLIGGIAVGVVEALIRANVTEPQVVDIVLFAAVLLLVLARGRGAAETTGRHALAPALKQVPSRLQGIAWVRRMPLIAGVAGLAAGILLPVVISSPVRILLFSEVAIFALVALSVTVLTGWAGQLSLGQFGFAAVGAALTAGLTFRGVPFLCALVLAAAAGVLVAIVVGLPALRVRGLFLSITTLAFGSAAVAATGLLLSHRVLGEEPVLRIARPSLGPIDLSDQRSYYYLCLVILTAAATAVGCLRRSGVGRTLLAVRDNETNAAAFTISPTRSKLTAFAVSGGLAAIAGGLLGGLNVTFGLELIPIDQSVRAVAITVIGGLGSVPGSILGAAYVLGVPALFNNAFEAGLLTSSAGLLIVLMYLPRGITGAIHDVRDQLLLLLERRHGRSRGPSTTVAATAGRAPAGRVGVDAGARRPRADAPPALRAADITVSFDGRQVLDRITIEVGKGEVVGLIGGNGAGKTTLMNAITGVVPSQGSVELGGRDITPLPAHRRARAGLGRAFQAARLFDGLTVLEGVELALEGPEPSELVPSLLGLPPSLHAERRKRAEAGEIISFLGLGGYADALLSELSTGTRRIAELACLMALRPSVLLLDEPTAGIAQREVEAFGPLILAVQAQLGASLLIIEHDIPMLLSISDQVCCLAEGRVIAEGPPEEVRRDPRVIASYLGTGERSIQRSGRVPV